MRYALTGGDEKFHSLLIFGHKRNRGHCRHFRNAIDLFRRFILRAFVSTLRLELRIQYNVTAYLVKGNRRIPFSHRPSVSRTYVLNTTPSDIRIAVGARRPKAISVYECSGRRRYRVYKRRKRRVRRDVPTSLGHCTSYGNPTALRNYF